MSVPVASTAEVIADRYLTSPVSLRSRPFGPVDALDTHAGRAAQVRIVFLPVTGAPSGWPRRSPAGAASAPPGSSACSTLVTTTATRSWCFLRPGDAARAVARDAPARCGRCRPAGAGVRSADRGGRRPPGLSPTWPSRLTLVSGRGRPRFSSCRCCGRPDAPVVLRPELDGQVLIARLYRATVSGRGLPPGLDEWVDRAESRGSARLPSASMTLEAAAHRGTRKPRAGRARRARRRLRRAGDRCRIGCRGGIAIIDSGAAVVQWCGSWCSSCSVPSSRAVAAQPPVDHAPAAHPPEP